MDSHRSRRLRWLSTVEVDKSHRGISQRYFFILSTDFNPLRCLNMSEHTQTTRHTVLRNLGQDNGCYVFSISGWVRFYRDERPAISFQYLYCLLWRIPIVKWNSLERIVLNLTGSHEKAVNDSFYLLFVFTSGWRGLLTGPSIRW